MAKGSKQWKLQMVVGPAAQQYFHDWRREWTVGQDAMHLTPHSTEGDRARAPQPDSGAGDLYLPNWPPEEAEDARDDAEDDDVGYMQTHATGSSSSSSRPVVPEGCLAAAMVRRALRRLAAVLATTSEVELQQRVENLMLQMDPHSLGGTTEPPSRGEALQAEQRVRRSHPPARLRPSRQTTSVRIS